MSDCTPAATPLATGTKLMKSTSTPDPAMQNVPYQSAIGAIMYAMLGTRPDIAYAVTTLSQFSTNPTTTHWTAVKRVLRYLKGSMNYKITYRGPATPSSIDSFPVLTGYSDADWGADLNDRKSITGYVFFMAGGPVSWQSKKQPTVALSSVEAEYMSATQATKEALWWKSFLKEFGAKINYPIQMYSDSQGAILLAKNPEYHSRTKHIDIQHHFVREHVLKRNVKFDFISTKSMPADILTKALSRDLHNKFTQMLSLH
jgi:hypothetical protein